MNPTRLYLIVYVVCLSFALRCADLNATVRVEQIIEHNLYSQKKGMANIAGLCYDPKSQRFFLISSGTHQDSFIYIINTQGDLLDCWDYQKILGTGSYPLDIAYDNETNKLLILSNLIIRKNPLFSLLMVYEMDMQGRITRSFPIPDKLYCNGLMKSGQTIWLCSFVDDSIIQVSSSGAVLQEKHAAGFPTGFPGPFDICHNDSDGFYLLDHFGKKIMEMDSRGNITNTIQMPSLWKNGKGYAIDYDPQTDQLFVNDDDHLYTLQFVSPNPNPDIRADINTDQIIDLHDMTILLDAWLDYNFDADLNLDNFVNILDFEILSTYWLKTNPTRLASPDLFPDNNINLLDFDILAKNWLQQNQQIDLAPYPYGDGAIDTKDLLALTENWLSNPNP